MSKPKKYYNRPDVARIQECFSEVCCTHNKVWVEYKDEPVWSYLICPFCGEATVANTIVPDSVRATFNRSLSKRQGKDDLDLFDKQLQARVGLSRWSKANK